MKIKIEAILQEINQYSISSAAELDAVSQKRSKVKARREPEGDAKSLGRKRR